MRTTIGMALVSVLVAGCYESYQNYGTDDVSLEVCVIQVTTNALDGAAVTVDGVAIGDSVELRPGAHTFSATAAGYFPVSRTVEVGAACESVALQLFPDLNGDYDLVLHNRIYDRLLLHLDQDGEGNLVGYDWYEDDPGHSFEEFTGTVTIDGVVQLLSDDSVRMDLRGNWTPPRLYGIARISGTWTSAAGGGGDWVAESRP